MTGYLLSPAAQADLEQIWEYAARSWGEDQAARYTLGIRDRQLVRAREQIVSHAKFV